MIKRYGYFSLVLMFLTTMLVSCTTDFEVYAPEKEIRSVFCILNQQDSVQYLRIARAYQVEGDAVAYASETDLSVKGLNITLTDLYDPSKIWIATEEQNFPKDTNGDFYPFHTVYKFRTDGSGPGMDTLIPGRSYKLEIGASDDPMYISAATTVPEVPKLGWRLSLQSGAGNSKCLPIADLDKTYQIFWKNLEPGLLYEEKKIHYEVRAYFSYQENGVDKSVMWGPTELIKDNLRCNEGSGTICYQLNAKEILRYLLIYMPQNTGATYTYDTQDSCVANTSLLYLMPTSLSFEVTAVDEYLSNYMIVNDPKFQDLTGAKPEYTNLTVSNSDIDAVGIFGSVNTDLRYAILSKCAEYLVGLNGTPQPGGWCSWD